MKLRKRLALGIVAAAAVLVPAAPALAQYPGTPPPEVLPTDTETPGPTVEVGGRKEVRGVAVTGADVLGLAAIGGIAVAGGTVIVKISRRRA